MEREIIYSGTVIHNKTDSKPGTNSTTCNWENKTFTFKTNENTCNVMHQLNTNITVYLLDDKNLLPSKEKGGVPENRG